MPTIYLHYKFGCHILNNLAKNQQKKIQNNIEYYNMFNQGFDNLYYYPFKWSYYRYFGVRCHKTNLNLFFTNLINYIKDNNLENDASITNMVYGFINHLTLDTIMHPYINYQVRNLNIPHSKIEFLLDFYVYNYQYDKKWSNKIYKTLIPHLSFNNNLKNTLNSVFLNTYKEKNISKIFNKSHNLSYFIYRYLITDIHGIKSKLYKIIDIIFPMNTVKFSKSTFYNKGFNEALLNKEKLTWHTPRDEKETYNYSFSELYDISFQIALKFNKLAYEVIYNKKDLKEFIKLIEKLDIKNISKLLPQ